MRVNDYPPQEPLSENGAAYKAETLRLSAGITGIEVSYGPHPCQSLLLFPAQQPSGIVLAFMYGGGWTNGYKEMMAFMAPPLNAAGIIFASLGYRLAPQHTFPIGWHDAAAALAWLHANVARHGGDPRRLFVGGHSAGGHYAALLALRRDWQEQVDLPVEVIRGCLPISGIYDFTPGNGMAVRPRFLGPPEPVNNERPASPLFNIERMPVPFLLAHGTEDFPHLVQQSQRMEAALRAAGGDVERLELPARNHFQACYAGGEADGPWVPRAIAWMHKR